jgi:hypothetical protein
MASEGWFAFVKTYLIIVVLLLHHDVVINKHKKPVALITSLLWLPFYVWKWIELACGFSFSGRTKKKENPVQKVEPVKEK